MLAMRRIVLATCLALALPGAAFAGGLYRWVTKDGRVEVGPFPPPGVHAEPWQPEGTAPKPEPEPAPASRAEEASEPFQPSASHLSGRGGFRPPQKDPREIACEDQTRERAEVTRKRKETEQKIAQLEASIAKLDE